MLTQEDQVKQSYSEQCRSQKWYSDHQLPEKNDSSFLGGLVGVNARKEVIFVRNVPWAVVGHHLEHHIERVWHPSPQIKLC